MKKHQEYCEIETYGSSVMIKIGGNNYLQYENGDIRHYIDRYDAENYLRKNGWIYEKKGIHQNVIQWTKVVDSYEEDPIAWNYEGVPASCTIIDITRTVIIQVKNGNSTKYLLDESNQCRHFVDRFSAENYLKENGWNLEKKDIYLNDMFWIKGQEYCEIVDNSRISTIVKLGTNKYLRDEDGRIRFFPGFLEAANYLSKNGWYLSQIYSNVYGSSSYGTSVGSSEHWIMTRDVED